MYMLRLKLQQVSRCYRDSEVSTISVDRLWHNGYIVLQRMRSMEQSLETIVKFLHYRNNVTSSFKSRSIQTHAARLLTAIRGTPPRRSPLYHPHPCLPCARLRPDQTLVPRQTTPAVSNFGELPVPGCFKTQSDLSDETPRGHVEHSVDRPARASPTPLWTEVLSVGCTGLMP